MRLASSNNSIYCWLYLGVSQGRCHLLTPVFIARAAPLSLSLLDYTQHILILSFSHTSQVCLGMSQRLLPGFTLVLRLGMFPKGKKNKQTGKIIKQPESHGNTSPLQTPTSGWTLVFFIQLSRSFFPTCCLGRRLGPVFCRKLQGERGWSRILMGTELCYIQQTPSQDVCSYFPLCRDSETKIRIMILTS